MKKRLFAAVLCLLSIGASAQTPTKATSMPVPKPKKMPSLYDQNLKVQTLSGEDFDLSSLKGKKVMIVNTASKCGLTPQYKELESLYSMFKDEGFVIVGFPANDFAGQEPGSNKEIAAFCEQNYGVTFPMMAKISVKGDKMSPVYKFLTQKSLNGLRDSEVEWNFQKYLLNERGELVEVISPQKVPSESEMKRWIKSKS